ncbi:ATP-binding cassette domain-containing protein, partial [Streptomyces brasiliscabiei]|uniref:ATP-binding cassette domain-containing protein n=1 Tax=Streptomyces brasiliscabiei TaxID=2736302 RepID=UPI003AF42C00
MIQFNNVNFAYQGEATKQNLKKVDLSINEGELVLLCGASGCGKTTIVRLINGLV